MPGLRYPSSQPETVAGKLLPVMIKWKDGQKLTVDKVLDVRMASLLKAGGRGMRYTCRIAGRQTYLFCDGGKWFVEGKGRGKFCKVLKSFCQATILSQGFVMVEPRLVSGLKGLGISRPKVVVGSKGSAVAGGKTGGIRERLYGSPTVVMWSQVSVVGRAKIAMGCEV